MHTAMKHPIVWAILVLVLAGMSTQAAELLDPVPYLSGEDSPFYGTDFVYFYLEDCEDGRFNTPGVTRNGGGCDPEPQSNHWLNDSVDGDDGVIDGFGHHGYGYYSGYRHELRFTFQAGTLGSFPTHAGVVWTDVGHGDPPFGYGDVFFEAFGPGGVSLGIIGPAALGDGDVGGQTAEDRFFGAISADGISAISIRMPGSHDWEIDHLQYGFAEEAPPAPLILALDIKPGSCPNPVNLKSRGVLPVALLGTDDLDVSLIDIASITLGRADGTAGSAFLIDGPPGPNVTIEDIGIPFDGELCDCHELEVDGIDDLQMKFKTREVIQALELGDFEPGATVELNVAGTLEDGTEFSASDCVLIVPQSDFDEDNDVDQSDFGHLQACYRGPMKGYSYGCEDADIDEDGDVDISDFGRFQRCLSGANKDVDPECAD